MRAIASDVRPRVSLSGCACRLAAKLALTVFPALPALAQPTGTPPPPTTTTFLARSAFSVGFSRLDSGDPRLSWIARVNADADIVDYRRGRINFWGQYEGVLGSERRLLDLNHENYIVEASGTYRLHAAELTGVFHHESRHLSDRESDNVVAWNTITLRALHDMTARGTHYAGRLEFGRVLQHTYVDYAWTSEIQVDIDRRVHPRTSLVGSLKGELVGIDPSRSHRDRQCGARVEGGVQIDGHAGSVEFYAAYERRIDGYPLARQRARWFEVGFKLIGG